MSALVLVVTGVLMAQPAAETAPALAPTKLTLAEVLEHVRENEKHYRTVEMSVRMTTRLVGWKGPTGNPDPNAKGESNGISTSSVHVILDADRFLQEAEWASIGADTGKQSSFSLVNACDEKQTLAIYEGGARIEEGRVPHDDFLHPNTFLYRGWNFPTPFSKFMTMPDEHRQKIQWTVLGEEVVNGLRCVRLLFEQVRKDTGTNGFEAHFWLAMDRNYLPIKYEARRPWIHPQLILAYGSVTALKKLAPGVWVPERGESTTNEHEALKVGITIPYQTKHFQVESVTLNKKYDPDVFRPEISEGSLVESIKDGKVIETYREGGKK